MLRDNEELPEVFVGGDSQARIVPIPIDEDRRVDSLRRPNLLDTPAEECSDRIIRLARRVSDVPVVTVGLVDSTREWFESASGVPYEQIARRSRHSSVAVGIGTGTRETSRAGELVRQAERPLFEAKKSGGNRTHAS